jgi:hypothetical protein
MGFLALLMHPLLSQSERGRLRAPILASRSELTQVSWRNGTYELRTQMLGRAFRERRMLQNGARLGGAPRLNPDQLLHRKQGNLTRPPEPCYHTPGISIRGAAAQSMKSFGAIRTAHQVAFQERDDYQANWSAD